jgi:hypothetical protein
MPTYNFRNKITNEETEVILKMSGLDQYKLDNPDLEAIISGGAICESRRLDGNMNKKHGGWVETLKQIHSRTAGSCLDKTTNI